MAEPQEPIEGFDPIERALSDALGARAGAVRPSTGAFRAVERRVERRRRRRRRTRAALAGGGLGMAIAVAGAAVVLRDGPAEVVAGEGPSLGGDGSVPAIAPAEVPEGFDLAGVVDLAPEFDADLDYVQVLQRTTGTDRVVIRQSGIDPDQLVASSEDGTAVDINGAVGQLVRSDTDRASLTWSDSVAEVVRTLHGRGFTDAELVELATVLPRRIDRPGLVTSELPDGLRVISEGRLPVDDDADVRRGLSYVSDDPLDDAIIELTVRPGSELELELMRTVEPSVIWLQLNGIDRILVSRDLPSGEEWSLYWLEDTDVIVEATARNGATRAQLLSFAETANEVSDSTWAGLLDAYGDGDVAVASGPSETEGPAPTQPPAFGLRGTVDGTSWLLTWDDIQDPGDCAVLAVGATEAERCVTGDGPEAHVVAAGARSAVVVFAPGDRVVALQGPEAAALPLEGALGPVAIAWIEGEVPASLTALTASGVTAEVSTGPAGGDLQDSQDDEGASEGSPFVDEGPAS